MTTVDIRLNRGFSLVELLIAMALGLILTLGVLEVFLATKESFVLQQRSAAMQENARLKLNRLMYVDRNTNSTNEESTNLQL